MDPQPGWYEDPLQRGSIRWWDGDTWTAASQPALPVEAPAQTAVAVLPPGARVPSPPVGAPPPPAHGGAPIPVPDGCQVCGGAPTADLKLSELTGLVVVFQVRTVRGRWCRDCGEAAFREAQSRTLQRGWWGLFSALLTPIALLLNLDQLRRARSLAPPLLRTRPPVLPGPPVLRRPATLVALGVVALGIVLLATGVWH